MRSDILINIEFLAGSDIKEAIIQAARFARQLDIAYCCFSFNGVKCSISQNPDIDLAVQDFHVAIKDSGYVVR